MPSIFLLRLLSLFLGILVELPYTSAGPRTQDLERCLYLQERIAHYTRLRRGGGTALRMESWRQSRQRLEEEFRSRRCHRYGRRLRKPS